MDPEEQARRSGEELTRRTSGATRGRPCNDASTGSAGGSGLIALLIAVLIVAWLAKDALRDYGLLPAQDEEAVESREPTGLQRSPTPAAVSESPPGGASTSYQRPLERARSVESTVTRGAEAQGRRIDDATR